MSEFSPAPHPSPVVAMGGAAVSLSAGGLSFVSGHPGIQDLAVFVGIMAGVLSIFASLRAIFHR